MSIKRVRRAEGRSLIGFHASNYRILLAIFAMLFCSCSRRFHDLPTYFPLSVGDYPNKSVGRFKTSFMVDQIDDYYRGTDPGPIGVTSFVDLDKLESSSSFGRLLSEQLISELAMRGYDVLELRRVSDLQMVEGEGEFALSRSRDSLPTSQSVGGIVVGTYSVSQDSVFLNARLLDPGTSLVLSVASVEMEKTKEIEEMLRHRGGSAASGRLERIPVSVSRSVPQPLNEYPGTFFKRPPTVPPRIIAPPAPPAKPKQLKDLVPGNNPKT